MIATFSNDQTILCPVIIYTKYRHHNILLFTKMDISIHHYISKALDVNVSRKGSFRLVKEEINWGKVRKNESLSHSCINVNDDFRKSYGADQGSSI